MNAHDNYYYHGNYSRTIHSSNNIDSTRIIIRTQTPQLFNLQIPLGSQPAQTPWALLCPNGARRILTAQQLTSFKSSCKDDEDVVKACLEIHENHHVDIGIKTTRERKKRLDLHSLHSQIVYKQSIQMNVKWTFNSVSSSLFIIVYPLEDGIALFTIIWDRPNKSTLGHLHPIGLSQSAQSSQWQREQSNQTGWWFWWFQSL